MAGSYTDLVGAMPLATTFAFRRWYFELLGKRLETALRARATTYYFDAVSGNDSSGVGTQASPWKSITKAQAALDAWTPSEAGLALLFKRGTEFVSDTGLAVSKAYVTVGAYGTGARPLWSRFTLKLPSSGGGWVLVEGTHYKRGSVTSTVAWVRRQDDRLSPPWRMTSSAEVTGQVNSWWYDPVGQELHVNFGVDANTLDLEAVYGNDAVGVLLSGEGDLARDIRFDGWGINPSSTANQAHGVRVSMGGVSEAAAIGCESYYNSSHAIASYGATTGGVSTFVGCVAGYCIPNGSGETIFNSYVANGDQETLFHGCRAAYGTLPAGTAPTRRGTAIYAHTGGAAAKLLIAWGTKVDDGACGCGHPGSWSNVPTAERLEDVRGLMVDEEARIGGSGAGPALRQGVARINPRWWITVGQRVESAMDPLETSGWMINGQVVVDLKEVTASGRYTLYNGPTPTNRGKIYHSHVHVVGNGVTNFCLDYDVFTGTTNASAQAEMASSILSGESMGTGELRVGLNNDGSKMRSNAYYGVVERTDYAGFSNDAGRVVLNDLPVVGLEPWEGHPLYEVGSLGPRVEYDAYWRPRDLERPTIGPVEGAVTQGDVGALRTHLDDVLGQIPGQIVEGMMAREVDGVSYESTLETLLAVMAGVAARSGGTVTFYRRDGQTAKVLVGMGDGDGERVESVIY
ncbi:MAG: hypothetical protein IT442_11960 [Phycisphaeraceae bacterium]|nr:hypothetical protein [Phycisphaeraceae bacterium]